jgi:FKBP-type peptidyl-prolyl cis-trans isomerase FkpA
MRRVLPLFLLVLAAGCTLDSVRSKPLGAPARADANPNIGAPESVRYHPSLAVDVATMVHTPSGLYWKDLAVGTGAEAVSGSQAVVEYTGWLPDARQFDSSRNSGQPYTFPVGQGLVIAGWDEGVAGMRVGGRRLLVIPPELGYGANGSGGVIPGGATLIFEVKLLDVRGES